MMSAIDTFIQHVQDNLPRTIGQDKDIEMCRSWKGRNKTF